MQRGPHARLPPWLAQVLIVRSTTITLTPSSETDVSVVYRGFIHPLLPGGPGGPGAEDVAVWARAQRLHVLARMARGPDTENMVRVPGTCRGLFMVNMGAWMCGGEEEWGEVRGVGSILSDGRVLRFSVVNRTGWGADFEERGRSELPSQTPLRRTWVAGRFRGAWRFWGSKKL